MGEKKHKFKEKEEPPNSEINQLLKMDEKRQGQAIQYIGRRLLEGKQFRVGRTVMSSSN